MKDEYTVYYQRVKTFVWKARKHVKLRRAFRHRIEWHGAIVTEVKYDRLEVYSRVRVQSSARAFECACRQVCVQQSARAAKCACIRVHVQPSARAQVQHHRIFQPVVSPEGTCGRNYK
eukprot:6208749-Pleurochrysis_carterae.AAC.2